MATRVLVVEDDISIADPLRAGLLREGYEVVLAGTAAEAFAGPEVDIVLLDLGLPDLDGRDVCRRMRERSAVPIIVVTARGDEVDRVVLLELGADDYLVKPFAFSEMLARLQALIRRSNQVAEPMRLAVGPLTVDLIRRKVERDGQVIELQPLEFALLEYLMRNAGRVVSKTMIMEHVWDYNFDPQTNVIEARMSRLRDKIDHGFERKLIHTVRGAGYVLRETA
jgi:two-component system OmpR family response regulator